MDIDPTKMPPPYTGGGIMVELDPDLMMIHSLVGQTLLGLKPTPSTKERVFGTIVLHFRIQPNT